MSFEVKTKEIPVGDDPYVVINAEKDGIPASVTITLHFEGDWSNIYDDMDETEDEARGATAGEIFAGVLNIFK